MTTLSTGSTGAVPGVPTALRDPIAASWRRASLAGVQPESALERLRPGDVDLTSPLLAAATPVLDDLNERLRETMFCTLLVDREGQVAQRWCGDRAAASALDELGVDLGVNLLEESVGTNALGTVLETRRALSVHGEEHYAVPLKRFSCYGHPIVHPTTKRIEGVLDITALVDRASPLLPPLVARAVADIEQRLLDGSRISEKELLLAFQLASARRRPVVAVGEDLMMSNQAALDLLGSTDTALLRMIGLDLARGRSTAIDLTLASGTDVVVRAERVTGARSGMLLHLEPALPRPRPAALPVARPPVDIDAPVLVAGAPGTGRSTRARQLAEEPVSVLTAAAAMLDGPEAWVRDFASMVRAGQGTLCIDGVDLLPPDLVELVASHVALQVPPRLVLVSGPVDHLEGRVAGLAAECLRREELPPLSARLTELPALVAAMLVDLGAPRSLHLTPSALAALSRHSWPGNLRELRAVVRHASQQRSTGAITIDDLPEQYRARERAHQLAPIERAERDAIIGALREHGGNKLRTARTLGISRTTLYAKMRSLRITHY
ncbi:Transcriptional regulator of acetoin/glycerol metabolism [Nocardioides scoriae]|uniref:Transcriptional regulator of acetoin/glycerol metabolism n=1 Tax=Nocardioides scoriae TaxID=642780 RepID=A0A1H1XPB6_9ACTN|nr:helix-turn-helix domain-containing protein [Nocardioides scoriae]SDT11063.1 Transcriptional regulator of acetoin/glycerol metabolism [Nocardioides scoriae]